MKPKFRTTSDDPRSVTRSLFYTPFNPSVNFAIEDPLHLSSHPTVRENGLSYSKQFGSGSPLSIKAPALLAKKQEIETTFSDIFHQERSLILPPASDLIPSLAKSFLPSQTYFVGESTPSLFPLRQTKTFSLSNLSSLEKLLEEQDFTHLPIVYIPKVCPLHGRANFKKLAEIKEKIPFFLIIEDNYTFGLEGLYGASKSTETALIDLLITHIPKAFGRMLSVVSGSKELLDHLFEYSFYNYCLFPKPAYLGMLESSLILLESMKEEREALKLFEQKIRNNFSENITLSAPLITFHLSSLKEKEDITKELTDKGFLLPAAAFKSKSRSLTLHLNYKLCNSAIHSISEAKENFSKQIILESI